MKAPNARPSWQPPPPHVLDVVWLASFEHARRRAWETNLDTFTMKKVVLRFRPARGVFCDTTSGSPLVTMRALWRTKPDSSHSYGPPLNGIRLPSPPALPLQLNGLHIPSYQKAASTTKQIPYHSCSQTEVNSSAFSTAEAQAWDQEAKRIHYDS